MDRLAGAYACNHTHTFNTDLQSHRHTGRKAVHMRSQTKTQIKSSLLACPPATKQTAEGGPECGDMLQQMAPCRLLILLLCSSRSSATCGGGHALSVTVRPPRNPGCRSFIMKGTGHLKLKFVVRVHGFSRAHTHILHITPVPVRLNESESHSDTDGSLSLWANCAWDLF